MSFQPKWNNALLEMFRIDYVGAAPYISCHPSLYHYRVGPKDKFLILSSDGLYQYLTNEEAVTQVEMFLSTSPDGDPAQHLIEELLFRAAAKAGLSFSFLLLFCSFGLLQQLLLILLLLSRGIGSVEIFWHVSTQ
jgi:Protein phosphatase 2C